MTRRIDQCINCCFEGSRRCAYHGYPEDTIPNNCSYKIGYDALQAQINLKGTSLEWGQLKSRDNQMRTEGAKAENKRVLDAIQKFKTEAWQRRDPCDGGFTKFYQSLRIPDIDNQENKP